MVMKSLYSAAAAVVCSIVGYSAWAAPATQPAQPSEKFEQLTAKVAAVKGLVEIRANEDQPWQKATIGMIVPVGGECRTGPRSYITMTLAQDQILTLDRLGTVKILEALQGQTKLKTDIGMKYGRVRYEVEAAGLQHESVIRSPSNALAIRGSRVIKTDDGIEFSVMVLEGLASLEGAGGSMTLGTGVNDSYGSAPIVVNEGDKSPADHNFSLSLNPYTSSGAFTNAERGISSNIGYMAASNAGLQGGLQGYRTGTTGGGEVTPPVDTTVGSGNLSFNLSWTGDRSSGNSTPDLDMFVLTPKGEVLIPGTHATTTASGAVVSANNHGGPDTSLGTETIEFPKTYPYGKYSYGVRYINGGDPASFRVLVFLDGKQINGDYDTTVTPLDNEVTFGLDVAAPQAPAAAAAASSKAAPKVVKAPITSNARITQPTVTARPRPVAIPKPSEAKNRTR